MAGIWAQTLGMQRVGIHDNFFRIGGHSLLAAQTVARMSEVFGADIPMTRLFGAPSIAAMAKVVEELVQSGKKAIPASSSMSDSASTRHALAQFPSQVRSGTP